MADTEKNVKLRVSADVSGLPAGAQATREQLDGIGTSAEQASAKATAALTRAQNKLDDLARSGGEAAQAVGKGVDVQAVAIERSANESVRAIGQFGGVVAGLVVAFGALVAKQIDYAAGLATLSQRLAISTEDLSALGAAARRNDSDFRTMESGLTSLADSAARASAGVGQGAKQTGAAFAALGVDVRDANGQIRPTTALLEDVARGLNALPDGALKTRLATELLGSAGEDLQGTLHELAEDGLQGVIDKANETGQLISTQTALQAKAFKDELQQLQDRVGGLALRVGQALLPTLLELTGGMDDVASAASGAGTQSNTLRGFFEDLGRGVVVTTETLRVLFTMLYAGIDLLVGVGEGAGRAVQAVGFAAAATQALQSGQLELAGNFAERAKNAFGAGWDAVAEHAKRAWSNIEATGANADAAIADYDARIARSHSQFANVVGGTGRVLDENETKTNAQAEALKRWQAALAANSGAQREHTKETIDAGAALAKLDDLARSLAGKVDPFAAAWDHYQDALHRIAQASDEAVKAGNSQAVVAERQRAASAAAAAAYAKETGEIQKRNAALLEDPTIKNYEQVAGALSDYQQRQLDEIEQLQAEIDARGQLTPLQQAELDVRRLLAQATDLNRDRLEAEAKQIKANAAELQRLRAVQSLGQDFSNIFNSAANSVANGAGAFQALGDAALPVLANIAKGFDDAAAANAQLPSSMSDTQAGFAALGDAAKQALPALAQFVALAIAGDDGSKQRGAATGSIIGGIIGGIIGTFLGGNTMAGYQIGSAIGGAAGAALASGTSPPMIYVGGGSNIGHAIEGTQEGALGTINVGTEGIKSPTSPEIAKRVRDFDAAVAGILPPELIDQVAARVASMNFTAVSIEELLAKRMEAVLDAIDPVIGEFVKGFSSDVQQQLQALADVFAVQGEIDAGRGLGVDLATTLALITEFGKAGARVAETFQGLVQSVNDWDSAQRLMGFTMEGTREEVVRFAATIADAAGSAERAADLWSAFFANFYDDTERNLSDLTALRQTAADALAAIGLDPAIGKDAFREAFEAALPSLTPEQVVQWLEAGKAISDASTAADALADALKQGQVDYADFIASLNDEGAGLSTVSPFAAQRLAIEKWEQDSIKRANELARAAGLQSAAEQDLTLIHEIAAHRIAEAIAALQEKGTDLVARMRGEGEDAGETADAAGAAVRGFGEAMTSTAQAAQAAADLLLGSLSPLNDEQKLQYGIDAYARGLVDIEDVLQVARRLYGSSVAYEDVYNRLQGIRPAGGPAGGDVVSHYNGIDPATASTADQATTEESERQRRNDAEAIAQTVASLANAQEISFADAADSIGTDLAEMASWLGLNQDELQEYLQHLVDQENAVPDSIGDSTDRIIAALYDIAGREPPTEVATGGERGHSTHARPGSTEESDGEEPGHSAHVRDTGPPQGGRPPEEPGLGEIRVLLTDINTRLERVIETTGASGERVVEAIDGTLPVLDRMRTAVEAQTDEVVRDRRR